MKRYCLTLDLVNDPDLIAQYRHLHSPEGIWPEIPEGIKAVGITGMDIYLLDTRLFMILEMPDDVDRDEAMARLATLPRQQEWEETVGRCQQCDPDATSAGKWQLMQQIFTLAAH
ncbi:MAG: L-rhamnose mutarotase [Muribaculaceae bacterium]|nr:L-rhamnose mutarotase [Muribaculaceae bacterium]